MDTPLDKNSRRNAVIVALLIYIAIFGILALIPAYFLKPIVAIIAFTISVILPVRQKRFSLYTPFLAVIGILFLLSGVIEQETDNFMSSLSVSSQIEFSKILRPERVSAGLSRVGVGVGHVMLAWGWWTLPRNRSQQSRRMHWWWLIIGLIGVLFIILGVSSIINGVSRL